MKDLANALRALGIPFLEAHDNGNTDIILTKDGNTLLGYEQSTTIFSLASDGKVTVAMM